MKNTLRVDHDARCIVMDRTFYKNASNIRFEEYSMLQRARQDYPSYTPVIQRQIRFRQNFFDPFSDRAIEGGEEKLP